MPRRRTSRAVHPLFALLVTVTIGIVVTIGLPSVARADPPGGWSGPFLEALPDNGEPTDPFDVKYWYVTTDSCPYATVNLTWDGNDAGSTSMAGDCTATFDFSSPPTSGIGGHLLEAEACYVDPSTGNDFCESGTVASTTYVINAPPPSLVLSPKKGIASKPFTATYNTGNTDCGGTEVQFFWDGAPIDPRVSIASDCSAEMDFPGAPTAAVGAHTVSAQECEGSGCFPSSEATATYTVAAPPTPRPTARPRSTPTATPTATPTPTPTPIPSASAIASVEPSVEPSTDPTPEPSGEVLEETSPPQEPSPAAVAVIASSPPSDGNPYVPAIVSYVGGPAESPIDPAVVATNLLLTLLVVFLFGLTAEVFNSTMDAHRDEVHGWWLRLMRGPLGFLGPLTVTGASLTRLAGVGRLRSIGIVLLVLCLLGLIYSFLSPDFGLNPQTSCCSSRWSSGSAS